MAALASVSGFISLSIRLAALVDSEGRGKIDLPALIQEITLVTGTGSTGMTADMIYFDEIELSAGQAASDAIDLAALSQAGASMNMLNPKAVVLIYRSGNGKFFLDRGATNGYSGFPADGVAVDKDHPIAVIPCYSATSGSSKTLATSETAGTSATVKALVAVYGTSA